MIIYRITNKNNGKKYIGQTKTDLQKRWRNHINNPDTRSAIAAAINKYGEDSFEIEELAKADNQDQLDELERLYIDLNDSMAPNGYNLKTGGLEGSRYGIESREKMSKAKIGNHASQETKDKMSKTHKERWLDPNLREQKSASSKKVWSDPEYREKISKARKEYWADEGNRQLASNRAKQMVDDEYLKRVSDGVKKAFLRKDVKDRLKKATDKNKKSVIRSDGKTFDSLKSAAEASGTRSSSIARCISGRYKSAGGFTWKYLDGSFDKKVEDFDSKESYELPTVYLLIGAPAAGKSWVANQLTDKFDYISYDGNRKKTHIDLLRIPSTKPKLYDPTFKISTVIRRHSDEFNFVIVAIQEDEQTLRQRMSSRGGKWTDTIMKRNEQVRKRYEKYGNGGFIGTSTEVLDYLKTLNI